MQSQTHVSALFRAPTPEEVELLRRRAQLAAARAVLAARETALDELRGLLFSFEGRYIRQLGVLYTQLDQWNERIAALHPEIPTEAAPVAGVGDPGLASETWAINPDPVSGAPKLDLKALFREVAKRIHPDFAVDDHDERRRTHLMAQANDAYLRQDAAILERMLHGYDPAAFTANDAATRLAQVLAGIAQTETDIAIIDTEYEALSGSDMADLRRRTIHAATQGRDLLAELAAKVQGRIGLAMRRYELDLGRIKRKQAAFNPEPLLSAERR